MSMAIPLGMHGGKRHSHIWWWFKSQQGKYGIPKP